MYKTERYSADVTVDKILKNYVNVEHFIEFCKNCGEYNKNWSCPEHDFDPKTIWSKYNKFHIVAIKIVFDDVLADKEFTPEEISKILKDSIELERTQLEKRMRDLEHALPESMALSAGSCNLCGKNDCKKISGKPCCHPKQMRYSIESLGGNVSEITKDFWGIDIKWIEDGKLPEYFTLVCGLLM